MMDLAVCGNRRLTSAIMVEHVDDTIWIEYAGVDSASLRARNAQDASS